MEIGFFNMIPKLRGLYLPVVHASKNFCTANNFELLVVNPNVMTC